MDKQQRRFNLDELSALADVPKRTVRYYIQIGLLDRPDGKGRGAHYRSAHLDRLLEIRKWSDAGLSLERIQELIGGDGGAPLPPPRPRRPGSVAVCSHIVIDDGIELVVEPGRAGISPEQLRELADGVMALYSGIKNQEG